MIRCSFTTFFVLMFCLSQLPGSLFARTTSAQWVSHCETHATSSTVAGMVVDHAGNVIVTSTVRDPGLGVCYISTIKYDTNGQELWGAGYFVEDAPRGTAMAIDGMGNIYVAGYAQNSDPWDEDILIMKFDPNGILLWVTHYDGGEDLDDRATAMVVDDAGMIYITGYSEKIISSRDYVTVKYDTHGNLLWDTTYNGPALPPSEDEAIAIGLDSAGNILVTGSSDGSSGHDDYATVKYDTNGTQLWVARYDGTAGLDDRPSAIAVGGSGAVHVTGESQGDNFSMDYATVKYDTNGNQLWAARFNGPAGLSDIPSDIALDSQGNVLVTGSTRVSVISSFDIATIKYDQNGNELWLARYDGPDNLLDESEAMVVDGSGNVHITGSSRSAGSLQDFCTLMYDPDGQLLATEHYDGVGSIDSAAAIALDDMGMTFVAGTCDFDPHHAYEEIAITTIKYDLLNVMNPVDCTLDCTPNSGTLPFDTTMSITLRHKYPEQVRRIAARIDLVTGSGSSIADWRRGYTNVSGGSVFTLTLNQTIPDLATLIGENVFTLVAEDVTPPPYNQPPFAPSGESNSSSCTVTGLNQ